MAELDKKIIYAVMRLQENVTFVNPFTGKEEESKIEGIRGYIPCFETLEEAEDSAEEGKYQILEMTI